MTCKDRDQDLLLFGLGELPTRQHREIARHLRTCARCRARQAELAAVSGQIATALRPPPDGADRPTGPGRSVPAHPLLHLLSSLPVLLAIGVLIVSLFGVWYVRSHVSAHPDVKDIACQPGLPSDRCR